MAIANRDRITEPLSKRVLTNIAIYLGIALVTALVALPLGGVWIGFGAILYLPLIFLPFLLIVELFGLRIQGSELRAVVVVIVAGSWGLLMVATDDQLVGLLLVPAACALALLLRLPRARVASDSGESQRPLERPQST